ncbi:phytanoyl-CoA dioxygenase family protein [Candidatus Pelagibacter sp.]|jgi:ectoine hydroxylase-related dioxygenase (phytanoyl-CoA dioxygenase family)|nr:phytanoyl-CoA dioxygenase family protein [Candidatus Pelagibacter sp.]
MRSAFNIKDKNIKSSFNENGYAIIENFFSKKECNNFLKVITKYSSKEYPPIMNPDRFDFLVSQSFEKIENFEDLKDKTNFIRNLLNDANYFKSIITSKKILNLLKKIKNKKINALMSQMIFKKANTKYSLQSWEPHQDNSYPKNKNGEYITINIFMNNSTKKNGTLYIWEKSHMHGIFDYKSKISYREKDHKPGNIAKSKEKFNIKILNFQKGDLLILHGNLVHGSFPNRSNKSRPLYSASYLPSGEKFISGASAQRKIID